jgi:hypothetical protein
MVLVGIFFTTQALRALRNISDFGLKLKVMAVSPRQRISGTFVE